MKDFSRTETRMIWGRNTSWAGVVVSPQMTVLWSAPLEHFSIWRCKRIGKIKSTWSDLLQRHNSGDQTGAQLAPLHAGQCRAKRSSKDDDPLGSNTLITAVDKWHKYDRCFVGYVVFGYINTTTGRRKCTTNGKPKFRKWAWNHDTIWFVFRTVGIMMGTVCCTDYMFPLNCTDERHNVKTTHALWLQMYFCFISSHYSSDCMCVGGKKTCCVFSAGCFDYSAVWAG